MSSDEDYLFDEDDVDSGNEYDTMQNENDKNNDPFRKNKSTVYGTPKNQRRNTKGTYLALVGENEISDSDFIA